MNAVHSRYKTTLSAGLVLLAITAVLGAGAQNLNNPNKRGPLNTQVNTFTGNLFLPRTDIYVPARGFDVDISFYYNSYNFLRNNGYGAGWNFMYDIRYKPDTAAGRTIIWGDGREDAYAYTGSGYKAPRGFFNTLSQYGPDKYLLTEPDGMKYFFDNPAHKRITRMEEPAGNYINFVYTDSLLTSLVNGAGQSISFAYNSKGQLTTVTDAIATPSRSFTYGYDAKGNLTQVQDPLGGKIRYTYLVNGPVKTLTDKADNLVNVVYFPDLSVSELVGCNRRVSFSYDTASKTTLATDHLPAGNQVTKYTYQRLENLAWLTSMSGNCCGFNRTFEFDDQGNRIRETDANGNVYAYTYDDRGNRLTATDPLNGVSKYSYEPVFNNLTGYTDPKGNVYALQYDAKGNLTQLTAPGGQVYAATYNAAGDIVTSTDPRGNVYAYGYDAYGNPTAVSGPAGYNATLAFDARGRLLSFTDARSNTYTAEYDILNRLKKITDPLNDKVQLSYDAEGNMTLLTDKRGETTVFDHDASNRIVAVKRPQAHQTTMTYDGMNNLLSVRNAAGAQTSFSYDKRNRLTGMKDASGASSVYNYDAAGNVTQINLPNGQSLNYTYDGLNRLTAIGDAAGPVASFTYDKNGNLLSFTNGAGNLVTATYNGRNKVEKLTDALGYSRSFVYDAADNLISVTDRNGFTRQYTYDGANRVKTYTDNNGSVITLAYDAQGNVAEARDQNNHSTLYTYDALNRLSTVTYPDGKYRQYSYDKANNLTAARLADGTTISYAYDSLNHMTVKTLPGGQVFSYGYDLLGRVISATNGSGTVTLTYDVLNRITSETFDGRTTRYAYSVAGRTQTTVYPDSTVVVKSFDTRNRLTGIAKNGSTLVSYQYNGADRPVRKIFANGVTTDLQYDFADRLTGFTTANGLLQNTTFGYDKERNKTAVNRLNNPSLSEQFTYDNGYRLTAYKRGNTVQNTYTYDAAGNRTAASLAGVSTTYTVNSQNQLTSVNGTARTYDNRGNLTFDGTFYKTYDAENRLLKDSSSPAAVIAYAYDALNRRVVKTVNGTVFKYTFSGAMPIEERNGANALLNRTVFAGFLAPVAAEKAGSTFYYHQNELNSVEAITNSSGGLAERYQYDAYGRQTRYDASDNALASSPAGNRIGFTGQEWDSATGSNRFFFRNYSPATGTFDQQDLTGYKDGTGLYQYVHNNPVNGIDVWGLEVYQPEFDPPVTPPDDCPPGKEGQTDYLSYYDTFSDAKSYSEVLLGLELPPGVSLPLTFVGMPVDLYKTGQSLEGFAHSNSTEMKVMNAGDAIKNGTNAALGGVALTAAAAGPAGAPVVAVVGATGATIFVVDKTSQAAFDYYWNSNALAIENAAMLNSYDSEKWRRAEQLKEWKIKRHQQRLQRRNCPPEGGKRDGPIYKWDPLTGKLTLIWPIDPNEIVGPAGEASKAWVSVKDRMEYTVRFENDTQATAPAKIVRITSPVQPKQDPATFQLGSFGFNNQSFDVPAATSSYYRRLDCRDSMHLYVDLTAGYDPVANQFFWEFQSIDPVTLLPSDEPLAGLLFLQDTSHADYGHGFVNFSVKPLASAHTLDTIGAKASIIFDGNEPLATNVHTNTIDALAPTSGLAGLPNVSPNTTVNLHLTGSDDAGGSGLRWYSVYVSDNGAAPQLYLANFTKTDTMFKAQANHAYRFYVSATDSVGNAETLRLADSIRISNGEQVICPGSTASFESNVSGTTYQWQVNNGTGFTDLSNGGVYSGASTAVLTLTAAPSSLYGYQYRCLVNGTAFSNVYLIKFGTTWQGTVSNAWEEAANWSCGVVPDANTDVTIDGGSERYPVVGSTAFVRSLQTLRGAAVTVKTGYSLTVVK